MLSIVQSIRNLLIIALRFEFGRQIILSGQKLLIINEQTFCALIIKKLQKSKIIYHLIKLRIQLAETIHYLLSVKFPNNQRIAAIITFQEDLCTILIRYADQSYQFYFIYKNFKNEFQFLCIIVSTPVDNNLHLLQNQAVPKPFFIYHLRILSGTFLNMRSSQD
ncbi:unnamed protein product [Paramecium octaurelia]|uniref:Uncharacterized protein n=1 Tax=Paramecium octaurelia TaxID=43137 RepID=A0A8S1S6C6_PAROT|nr:unnamed protein product [Paramecium octaurelia]